MVTRRQGWLMPGGIGLAKLEKFLHNAIFQDASQVTISSLERPSGGDSWETFFLTLAISRGSAETMEQVVIKRAPATGNMAPYEIDKDVVIFGALAASAVPVPRLLASTSDPSVFERPFTVTAFIEGESPDITKVERWPVWQAQREKLGYAIVDVAAALNSFRWEATDIPSVMGPRGDAAARVHWMIDRYLTPLLDTSLGGGIPQAFCRDVGMWLKENVYDIPENRLAIVHGDFRFGNFLFSGTSLVGVVDWERAMLGDPMSNLGFFCMPMARRTHPELMGKALLFEQMADRYERVNGLKLAPDRLHYYMIFWQFLESVNSARNIVDAILGRGRRIGSRSLLSPNLLIRQTLPLINDFESGRHVMLR